MGNGGTQQPIPPHGLMGLERSNTFFDQYGLIIGCCVIAILLLASAYVFWRWTKQKSPKKPMQGSTNEVQLLTSCFHSLQNPRAIYSDTKYLMIFVKQLSLLVRKSVIIQSQGQLVPVMRDDFLQWLDRDARLPQNLKEELKAFYADIDAHLYKNEVMTLSRLEHWYEWTSKLLADQAHVHPELGEKQNVQSSVNQGPIFE